MTPNLEFLAGELSKWNKSMLIDFILKKTLPVGTKLSDDLSQALVVSPVTGNSKSDTQVSSILESVVAELRILSKNSSDMCDAVSKIVVSKSPASGADRPATSGGVLKPPRDPVSLATKPSISSRNANFIVGSGSVNSNVLSSVPQKKYGDIFVSRFHPSVTSEMVKSELFSKIEDVVISQMVTKHPSYVSFHVHLPLHDLDEVLESTFWPAGILVKRFWGRLLPEKVVSNSSPSKN